MQKSTGYLALEAQLNWRLSAGSHPVPVGSPPASCALELARVIAGYGWRTVKDPSELEAPFCKVMAAALMLFNDLMPAAPRQALMKPLLRLYGSADGPLVMTQRIQAIAGATVRRFFEPLFTEVGATEDATTCRLTCDSRSELPFRVLGLMLQKRRLISTQFDPNRRGVLLNAAIVASGALDRVQCHMLQSRADRHDRRQAAIDSITATLGEAFDIGQQGPGIPYPIMAERVERVAAGRVAEAVA